MRAVLSCPVLVLSAGGGDRRPPTADRRPTGRPTRRPRPPRPPALAHRPPPPPPRPPPAAGQPISRAPLARRPAAALKDRQRPSRRVRRQPGEAAVDPLTTVASQRMQLATAWSSRGEPEARTVSAYAPPRPTRAAALPRDGCRASRSRGRQRPPGRARPDLDGPSPGGRPPGTREQHQSDRRRARWPGLRTRRAPRCRRTTAACRFSIFAERCP